MKYDAYWYGEHAVLGMWMMTTLVLMRSYAGNLISLLAVKHIPQPYQSLRDVLDDPAITMIWQKNSANEQYLRSVKSGIYREVSKLEDGNRLKFHTQSQFPESLHTLVKPGGHVLVDVDMNVRNLMTNDFSNTATQAVVNTRGLEPQVLVNNVWGPPSTPDDQCRTRLNPQNT
ncbi:hypothetical protein Pmani_018131 [Petrolisthes manimaculis]|uniref:Ionotropic glutamate receptor C-terminal domain-containing protein n=1 Tax=Petrolisthes manimaculis TaxID=1843537 RepID=A0AAE1PLM0_9EUCA|nr:hypothetical protein Pmani_018131 [Petrolisthes manimaculis]